MPLGSPAANVRRNLMDARFGGGHGFYEVDSIPPGPRAGHAGGLELTVGHATGTAQVGERLRLQLVMENRGARPIRVMRALDGSLEHMREPHYDLYLRAPSGRVFRWAYRGGRCGNVNPIDAEDYVTLAPGRRSETVPGGWASHLSTATVSVPGRYQVWVVYRFCGHGGRGLPLGRQLIQSVTPGVFASNAITIEVRP